MKCRGKENEMISQEDVLNRKLERVAVKGNVVVVVLLGE